MSATVVLCRSIDEDRVRELADRLLFAGFRVVLAPSLYDIPESSSLWNQLASLGSISAVWSDLHPRPTQWILHRHGLSAACFRYDAFESTEGCFEALLREIPVHPSEIAGSAGTLPAETGAIVLSDLAPAPRWHPVVDKDRCDDCGQCLQFCLFGVYTRDEAQHVVITNPDSCKTGCPACSRICPQGAIIFPMYVQDQAISGSPGLYMSPDANAKRMFYLRTKQACPVCKMVPLGPAPKSGDTCPECGGPYTPPVSPIKDDIDALIDLLDAQP